MAACFMGGGGSAAMGEEEDGSDHEKKLPPKNSSNLRIRLKCGQIKKPGEGNEEVVAQEAADRANQPAPSGDQQGEQLLGDQEDELLNDHHEDDEEDDRVPKCSECGKIFPSHKSLYGHLRCHPNRGYRGAKPPSVDDARKRSRPPAAANLYAVRMPSTIKWRSTERRGRKGTATTTVAVGDNDDELDVANSLLRLANLPVRDQINGDDTDAHELVVPSSKRIMNLPGRDQNGDDRDAVNHGDVELVVPSSKRTKKRKMKELVNEPNASARGGGGRRSYQCSLCSKTFSSHQALGGHVASHNKNRNNPEEAAVPVPAPANDNEGGGELKHGEELVDIANEAVVAKVAAPEHRCKSCNQTFTTGQALGGHQRRHFNEQAAAAQHRTPSSTSAQSSESDKVAEHEQPASSSLAHESSSSASDKRGSHGRFAFDLNKEPRPEEEEEED